MRVKPEMKPWVRIDKSRLGSFRSGTSNARIGIYPLGSAAPMGLNKCIDYYYPGLAPWAMQEYRPKGLFYDTFKINVSTSYSNR